MFFNYFTKNLQTTIALTFLTHIISGIDGVASLIVLYFYQKDFALSSMYKNVFEQPYQDFYQTVYGEVKTRK